MEFEYEYRREDENFRSMSLWKRLGSPAAFYRSRYAIFAFLPIILQIILIVLGDLTVAAAILGWVSALLWFWGRNIWSGIRIAADEASPVFGRKLCRIDEKGISIESPSMKTWHAWGCVRDIAENQKYISIYYDLIRAVVLPKKSFRSAEELAQFLSLVRKYASVSKIGEMPQAPVADLTGARPRAMGALLWIVILSALLVPILNLNTTITGFEPVADATAVVDKTTSAEDSVVALGTIQNTGKSDLRVSMLDMQFFDAAGKFIDQCTVFTYGLSVKAGASENFKASCGLAVKGEAAAAGASIMPSTLKHYAKVTVKVKGAYMGGASLFHLY